MAPQLATEPLDVQAVCGLLLAARREGLELSAERPLPLLGRVELGPERVGGIAAGDLVHEMAHAGLQEHQLTRYGGPAVLRAVWSPPKPLEGLLDGPIEDSLVQGLGDRVEHDLV